MIRPIDVNGAGNRKFPIRQSELLVVLTVATIVGLLMFLGKAIHTNWLQRSAAALVETRGGTVFYGDKVQWREMDPFYEVPPFADVLPSPFAVVFPGDRPIPWRELQQLTSLQLLGLNACRVSDADIEALTHLDELKALHLRETGVTDGVLPLLRSFPKLASLDLGRTLISDRGCEELAKLHTLQQLDVSGTRISNDGIASLCRLTQLRSLDLSNTGLTDAGLAMIGRLPHLRRLHLSGTAVTDDGLEHLAELSQLNHLSVNRTIITGRGFEHLANQQFTYVALGECPFSDEGLARMKMYPSLKTLVLSGCNVPPARIASIKQALPECHVYP